MASLVYPAGPPTTVCVMSPCASTSPSIRVGKRRPSVPSSVGPRGEVETGLPHRCRTGERDRLERLRVPRYRILSTQLRTDSQAGRFNTPPVRAVLSTPYRRYHLAVQLSEARCTEFPKARRGRRDPDPKQSVVLASAHTTRERLVRFAASVVSAPR